MHGPWQLKSWDETDKSWICDEHERLFGEAVCRTCISQQFEAYARLKTHYLNEEIMAKRKIQDKAPAPAGVLVLKPEYTGSTFILKGKAMRGADMTQEFASALIAHDPQYKEFFA